VIAFVWLLPSVSSHVSVVVPMLIGLVLAYLACSVV
jgi:hypothetical protein